MAIEQVFIGTELKYLVEITATGFSMEDDDFHIVVSVGNKKATYNKTDLLVDEEDNYYLAIDTSLFKKGDLYATLYAYVPDDDFPDGLRTEVNVQKLTTLKQIK